jgi:succinoglycan biosynthesis transport protein ExoP
MKNLENLTLGDYVAIFRRRFGYVVSTALIVTAGTVIYVKQLPPVYMSETTITVSGRFLPDDYIRSIDRETNSERMDFVKQQLQSRTFLEGIVREFHLAGPDGVENAAQVVRTKIEMPVLVTATAFKLGFSASKPELAQAITKRLAEKVIALNDSFRKEKVQVADDFLEQQLREAGDALSKAEQELLAFRSQSGIPATEVVNADTLRDLKMQLTKTDNELQLNLDQRKLLERRMQEHDQLKSALRAPAASASTATATVAATPSTAPVYQPALTPQSPLESQLASKRAELAALKTRYTPLHGDVIRLTQEVNQLEALVRQAQLARVAPEPAPAAPSISSPSGSPPVTRPVQSQGSGLPELDEAMDLIPAEIRLQMQQVDREIAKLQQAKNALSGQVSAYQSRLNPSPGVAQDLASLTRTYDAAKQRYAFLADKRLSSELASRADASKSNEVFKVADEAFFPRQALGPNRRLFAAIGGVAGLLVGLGIAFIRDFVDPALHTEEDALAELKLPVLASSPSVKPNVRRGSKKKTFLNVAGTQPEGRVFSLRNGKASIREIILDPNCDASENYRLLQTRLVALRKTRPVKTILVSSAVPKEGKTFSACCIAGILAQEPGKKVLLIDGDLRKPSLTAMLGLDDKVLPNDLSAVVRGRVELEKSIQRCSEVNLHFIPSGVSETGAADVLGSPDLEPIIRRCAEEFDWVVIDCPPILAAADVNLLARVCDTVLLVVRAGKTSANLVKESIHRIGADRICGVLLNRVRTVHSSYRYRSYRQSA